MAKISSYTFANPPTLGSYVIGTLDINSKDTKNFRISDVINLVNLDTFLDAGNSTNPITTIDLSLARTTKIRITGNTQLNFINQEVGGVYIILPYIDQAIAPPNVSFSSNVLFNGNVTPSFLPGNNIDNSFVSGVGFGTSITISGGTVYSVAIQSDGKVLVGGSFTLYKGITANNIIRLNADGSVDASFVVGTGFNSTVNSVAIQSDGKILIGGFFTTYQGVAANRIIRLNTNGSIDTSFISTTGFNSTAETITIQSDGKILVGGNFITYQGISYNRIIRLNADGSIDTSFVVGTGFSSTVLSITSQSDGKILVGGSFITYQGISYNRIVRLNSNGSIDTSFVVGAGFSANATINSISIQSDGKIVVGGSFFSYQGISYNRIIRLNADGSIDTSFIVGIGFSSTVYSVAIQSDGKILAVGIFSTYQDLSYNKIIRLNTNGSIDASFYVGTGFSNSVETVVIQPDGSILVGGNFNTYQGITVNSIVRLLQIPNKIYYKIDMVSDGVNLIAK